MMLGPNLMTVLQDTNPVPDPNQLAESDAAQELAMRRPGSVVDWSGESEDFSGDGYRIRLAEAKDWVVTHRGWVLAHERTLRGAFAVVEHHRREALRTSDLLLWASVFGLAVLTGVVAAYNVSRGTGWWVLVIVAIVYPAISAMMRFFAVLSRDLSAEYRRPLPWERRPWW